MSDYEYKISLQVRHPTRTLGDLAAALDLTPTNMWEAGAPRISKRGEPLQGVYDFNFWTASVMNGCSSKVRFCVALSDVLDRLSPKKELLASLTATGGRTQLFVGWFTDDINIDEVLDYELLGRLAEVRIDLRLDIYAGLDETQAE